MNKLFKAGIFVLCLFSGFRTMFCQDTEIEVKLRTIWLDAFNLCFDKTQQLTDTDDFINAIFRRQECVQTIYNETAENYVKFGRTLEFFNSTCQKQNTLNDCFQIGLNITERCYTEQQNQNIAITRNTIKKVLEYLCSNNGETILDFDETEQNFQYRFEQMKYCFSDENIIYANIPRTNNIFLSEINCSILNVNRKCVEALEDGNNKNRSLRNIYNELYNIIYNEYNCVDEDNQRTKRQSEFIRS